MTNRTFQEKYVDKVIKRGDKVWIMTNVSWSSYDCIPAPVVVTITQVKGDEVQYRPGYIWTPLNRVYGTHSEALFRSRPLIKKKLKQYIKQVAEMEEWYTNSTQNGGGK